MARKRSRTAKIKTPAGVKLISAWYLLNALLYAVIGLLAPVAIETVTARFPFLAPLAVLGTLIFFIVFALLAFFTFLLARGLWLGFKWAWFFAVLTGIIGMFSSIPALPVGIGVATLIIFVINAAIVIYLLSENIKSTFRK